MEQRIVHLEHTLFTRKLYCSFDLHLTLTLTPLLDPHPCLAPQNAVATVSLNSLRREFDFFSKREIENVLINNAGCRFYEPPDKYALSDMFKNQLMQVWREER